MNSSKEQLSSGIRFLDATISPPSALDTVLSLFLAIALMVLARFAFGFAGLEIPGALYAAVILGVFSASLGISALRTPKAFFSLLAGVALVGGLISAAVQG